ncbi:PepSY domain-containing protein [Candidatus Nitrospira neomarina]|uniref:PepSY domain-containing protein n=1 Tax=Candidatus Nitrospira neomarina TaxID=3020899 RepID=A0AA96JWB5_9BACT|nr:PepSY domain-containing protein [Candidatus Nitrospira neomarina]WNM62682.1 PepSY domain-containing protein [Candidatus Nitrospira neomarina]
MKNRLILNVMMATCLLPVSSALALFDEDPAELLKGTQITLVEAVEKAMTTVKGKAVDVELEKEQGKTVFEVKIVDENEKTREVYVDAHSGEVVKIEKD